MTDTCDGCGQEYELTHDTARLRLFITEPDLNHLGVTCPYCQWKSLGFMTPELVVDWLKTHPKVESISVRGSDSLRAAWNASSNRRLRPNNIIQLYRMLGLESDPA